jgi:hypothetical protein
MLTKTLLRLIVDGYGATSFRTGPTTSRVPSRKATYRGLPHRKFFAVGRTSGHLCVFLFDSFRPALKIGRDARLERD